MKKFLIKNFLATISVVLIFVFLLGQALGVAVIEYYFLQSKINELEPQLYSISKEIANGTFKISQKNDFIIKAYDINEDELDIFHKEFDIPLQFNDGKIKESLMPYISMVLSGKNIAEIKNVQPFPSKSILIGVPIYQSGNISGVTFLLKPASDFSSALNGFYLVFFIASIFGGAIIIILLHLYLKATRQLEQTRRDYIANISHELRTPISSIKALSETLCDKISLDESTKERYFNIMLSESIRLERLISDMLELSRLQSGKTSINKNYINGRELVKTIQNKFEIVADDIGIEFVVTEKAKDLPDFYSNEDRVLQILNILIDNAFKFTSCDGKVIIDAQYNDKLIKLSVIDNGKGIHKEDLPFVFDRFYKSDKVHNEKGSGLGLSIANEILKKLNESIEVFSIEGNGTTFTFTLHRK